MDRILRLGSGGIPGVGQVSKSIVLVLYVACISPPNNLSLSFLCYHHHFGCRVSCETFHHSAEKFCWNSLETSTDPGTLLSKIGFSSESLNWVKISEMLLFRGLTTLQVFMIMKVILFSFLVLLQKLDNIINL